MKVATAKKGRTKRAAAAPAPAARMVPEPYLEGLAEIEQQLGAVMKTIREDAGREWAAARREIDKAIGTLTEVVKRFEAQLSALEASVTRAEVARASVQAPAGGVAPLKSSAAGTVLPDPFILPSRLTVSSLARTLEAHDIDHSNFRTGPWRGSFWIYADRQGLDPLIAALESRGVKCRPFLKGRSKSPRPQWEIDGDKRLPE